MPFIDQIERTNKNLHALLQYRCINGENPKQETDACAKNRSVRQFPDSEGDDFLRGGCHKKKDGTAMKDSKDDYFSVLANETIDTAIEETVVNYSPLHKRRRRHNRGILGIFRSE